VWRWAGNIMLIIDIIYVLTYNYNIFHIVKVLIVESSLIREQQLVIEDLQHIFFQFKARI
jgi:hypothetical protein